MTLKKTLYVVTHMHEYGADTHILRADHFPSEEEVIAQFSLDYESDRGEEIEINAVNEETVVELGERSGQCTLETSTVVVEVAGGCVQNVWNLPAGIEWELLDWDNLLGDVYTRGDCETSWNQFDPQMQAWIQANYPDDYQKIQARIAEDRQRG